MVAAKVTARMGRFNCRLASAVLVRSQTVPQFVGENHDMIPAGNSLFRQEVAAHHDREPHHVVIAGRRAVAVHLFGLVFSCQVEVAASNGAETLEGLILTLPVKEITRGHPISTAPDLRPHPD